MSVAGGGPDNFSYSLRQVRVVFAEGAAARVPQAIDTELNVSRLFLVSTRGRKATVETIAASLDDRIAGTFDQARLHVPKSVVAEAEERLRASGAAGLIAVGGGSAIGLGKALARATGLPLVAVPTTYSGSEMTDIWGESDGARKVTGRDAAAAPRVVIYDPQLTYQMPAGVTGPSGMNAVAHAVEALYSSTGSPLASLLATDGIRRLAGALPVLVDQPDDRGARREALYGAHLCGRALDLTTMGLHHKLCHVLGGDLGLPHALTHAVLLPYVVAYNTEAAPEAMAIMASLLDADTAAQGLAQLNRRLGIDQTLADLGLAAGDVERIAGEVAAESFDNPAPVTAEGVGKLLERALAREEIR